MFQVVDRDEELIWWRQGRSLPYGEGLSYWALGEIVKAQAGILETDEADAAEAKLTSLLDDLVADAAERDWIGGHVRPLVGLGVADGAGGDRRSETHSAWRRLLEALAEQRPLVLVFEDLHWADDGLLDFVDYLAEWAGGVPMLILAPRGPSSLDRRPGWGGGKRNATTLSLAPLSREETARLLGELLEQTLLPAEIQSQVLSRAEGNPLYAEEYVRMLQDRGFLVRRDGTWRLEREGDLPLPETVHGMIAARLDALSRDEKELVQDAAVIGKVFWPGAVASMGDRSQFALEEPLHALERKEFIRRERRSAVAGETQYAFLHASFGMSRTGRSRAASARTSIASPRNGSTRCRANGRKTEPRCSRITTAGRSSSRGPRASTTRPCASPRGRPSSRRRSGRAVSTRSRRSSTSARRRSSLRARTIARVRCSSSDWPRRTSRSGSTGSTSRSPRVTGSSPTATSSRRALVDILLARMYWLHGNTPASVEHREHALRLVEERPLSFAKARVFAQQARNFAVTGSAEPALEFGERALPMAEELRDDLLKSHVLNTLGLARVALGDSEGLELMRRSVELAEASKSPDEIHTSLNNLANSQWRLGDLDGATESLARAREMNERFGSTAGLAWLDVEDMLDDELRGNWDAALSRAEAFLERLGGATNYLEGPVRDIRTVIFTSRGEVAAAEAEARLLLDHAREVTGEQLAPALADAARAFHAAGHRDEADALLAELLRDSADDLGSAWLRELPLFLVELGRADDYLTASEAASPSPWLDAGLGGRARRARGGGRPVCGDRRARDGGVVAVARGGEVRRRGAGRARARVLRLGARDAVRAAMRGVARLAAQAASGGMGPSASIS